MITTRIVFHASMTIPLRILILLATVLVPATRNLAKPAATQPIVPATAPVADPHASVLIGTSDTDKIIFLVDASGTWPMKLASPKNELQKAIGSLRPTQAFNFIFFQNNNEKFAALDKTKLLNADPENKRQAYRFLDDVNAPGSADPAPAIMLAFQQHPQIIYLITDGDFPPDKAFRERVAKLNKDHAVKINTVAFVATGDTDVEHLKLLEAIAKDNGGTYKHVAEEELQD